jgi:hypothetical protein
VLLCYCTTLLYCTYHTAPYCTVLYYYTDSYTVVTVLVFILYSYCSHQTVLTILNSPRCTHHIRIISLYASSQYRMRGVLRAFRGRLWQGGRHECSVGGASSGQCVVRYQGRDLYCAAVTYYCTVGLHNTTVLTTAPYYCAVLLYYPTVTYCCTVLLTVLLHHATAVLYSPYCNILYYRTMLLHHATVLYSPYHAPCDTNDRLMIN